MATGTQTKKSPLATFKDKYGAVVKLADTIELHHAEAYNAAAKKHLMEGGQLDYNKLKDSKVRQQMADTMTDTYVKQATEAFKTGAIPDTHKDLLMKAYHGVTKGELKKLIEDSEEDFTLGAFHGQAKKLRDNVHNMLAPTAWSHLTDDDKPGVIKAIGLEGKLDPKAIRLDELGQQMVAYHVHDGVVPPSVYNKTAAYRALKKPAPK
ncbi:MAG: hypothetical protein V1702_05710 [Candidatus Woesearchaeota archaeon]